MSNFTFRRTAKSTLECIETSLEKTALLKDARLNKDTAFSAQERESFKLHGLLPGHIETIAEQAARLYLQFQSCHSAQRQIFLLDLAQRNQTLFFYLVTRHLKEMLPIIYTPNITNAVQNFSAEFRRPYGCYISYLDRHKIENILQDFKGEDHIVIVTDGERILGVGDQGIGGIQISIAKGMLYTLGANVNPNKVLPIVLDVGTNNEKLLTDPLYLGLRQKRIAETAYQDFIATFVAALKKQFPKAILHWEDLGRDHAMKLLKDYRQEICSFNDDIQGTAVVTLAAIMQALEITQQNLADQRIVIFGAGSAGIGIADFIKVTMQQNASVAPNPQCWLLDKYGLLHEASPNITPEQLPYLRRASELKGWPRNARDEIELKTVIENVKPTILIGCSGVGSAFTQDCIEEMAKHTLKPIILALSNPNAHSEANPEDILRWTNGEALIATGSPFSAVKFNEQEIPIAQCNNLLAFPGVGLGALAVSAKFISDGMLVAASRAIFAAHQETQRGALTRLLLPPTENFAQIAQKVAFCVAKQAYAEGLTKLENAEAIPNLIAAQYWQARYLPYRRLN